MMGIGGRSNREDYQPNQRADETLDRFCCKTTGLFILSCARDWSDIFLLR
jgi:hypothetical protein